MKRQSYLLTLSLFVLTLAVYGQQEYNPYKSIGKKVKVLTASHGKYVEFFDYDTIQRIGTVMINIRTRKIVKLLNAQTTFKKYSDNSSSSRWYSPDLLAEKYASLSPYTAMGNNPILFSDNDGRELVVKGDAKSQDEYAKLLTHSTGHQVTINHETGVVSFGGNVKSSGASSILSALVDKVTKSNYAYQVSLTGTNGDDNGIFIDSYSQVKIDIADLKKISNNTDDAFIAGILGHFLDEISSTDDYNENRTKDGEFEPAHTAALAKEGEIVGGMLGIGTDPRRTEPQKVSSESAKKQQVIFSYGSGDKTVDYLLEQGVSAVKVTKGTINIGGIDVPTTTYETVTNGTLKSAQKKENN